MNKPNNIWGSNILFCRPIHCVYLSSNNVNNDVLINVIDCNRKPYIIANNNTHYVCLLPINNDYKIRKYFNKLILI